MGFLLAALGTIVPGLPGVAFIVLALIAHKMILPDTFSWTTIGIVGALSILSWVVDFLGGVVGAKMGGATKYGLIGATLGGFFGIFFGLPGLILGPFFGAILGDLYAKRTRLMELLKSGGGASIGFFISLAARLVILVVISVIVTVAAFV